MSGTDILLARLDAELARRDVRSELKYDGIWKLFIFHSITADNPCVMINSAFNIVRYNVLPKPYEWDSEFSLSDIGELDILADWIVSRVIDTQNTIQDEPDGHA
mgnify:CR=1 FL=1|tara:strand:- start:33 stop:344 length:312 start_codon:yes stop_codon:yes gene_type:complete